MYAPFESGLPSPTGRVYHHEIPGGQLSNLRQQAIALGLGDRFEDIENAYAGADAILGHLVKVTPSSKVVGDLALALVGAGVSAQDFADDPARYDIPDSVIGFLRGELGDPPGGWPEPLRTKALDGRGPAKPEQPLTPDDEKALAAPGTERQAALNRLLFPGPAKELEDHREAYGDTSGSAPTSSSTDCARGRASRAAGARCGAADRAGGHLRSRRTRHAHGDVHPQRSAASRRGARPQHRQ